MRFKILPSCLQMIKLWWQVMRICQCTSSATFGSWEIQSCNYLIVPPPSIQRGLWKGYKFWPVPWSLFTYDFVWLSARCNLFELFALQGRIQPVEAFKREGRGALGRYGAERSKQEVRSWWLYQGLHNQWFVKKLCFRSKRYCFRFSSPNSWYSLKTHQTHSNTLQCRDSAHSIYSHSSTMPAKEKMKQQLSELNHNDSLEKTLTNIPCIINTLRTIQQILSSI